MKTFLKEMKKNRSLYLLFLPVAVFFIIFSYGPMVGLLMAFQNYKPQLGFFKSPFVGLRHFKTFSRVTIF